MPQIISASRRTDIPALHSAWLMERIRAGHVDVANPMNARQNERVSLLASDVDALVLWTRHPRPLRPHLDELSARFGPPLWLVTLTAYPRLLERRRPRVARVVEEMHHLARRFGPDTVHWRYDPILLSSLTPESFHLENFDRLCGVLEGSTPVCHVSFIDRHYRKTRRRLGQLEGLTLQDPDLGARRRLAGRLAELAAGHGISVVSCCEPDLEASQTEFFATRERASVRPSACIDPDWIRRVTGRADLSAARRPTRGGCLCCAAKDIGAYDTCSLGCVYCYATRSDGAGRRGRLALR